MRFQNGLCVRLRATTSRRCTAAPFGCNSMLASWTAKMISAADVDVLLDAIALVAEPIRISYLWRPLLPDPGDDLVLETAVNGRADVIVTFNRRDFEPAANRFGLEVRTPGEAMRRLETRA